MWKREVTIETSKRREEQEKGGLSRECYVKQCRQRDAAENNVEEETRVHSFQRHGYVNVNICIIIINYLEITMSIQEESIWKIAKWVD